MPSFSSSVSFVRSRWSSPAEQSMPFDGRPRSLPFLMWRPFGRCAPTIATGTTWPSATFCAPVMIWMSSFSPTFIWQIWR